MCRGPKSSLAGMIRRSRIFFFGVKNISKTHTSGYQVRLEFILSQNVRDVKLLNLVSEYLNCGNVYVNSTGMAILIVRKHSDIALSIIPFFAKYPLNGSKLANYND